MYKYQIIAESIREKIHSNTLKPGEKLPSIKELVKSSGYNSDTVIKAYQLLEQEHLIYSAQRSGYYIVKSRYERKNSAAKIDLITVSPPESIHPYKDFYHCMEKSINIYKNKLLEYDKPQGMDELRTALVKYLMNSHIFTRQQDIFITNGAQQALYILATMLFPSGNRRIVVEQPTYSVMLKVLQCNNIPVTGVRRKEEGIDLQGLEAAFQAGDVKFFYIMPRFQNPTGFRYSKKERQEILELAARYGVYIVEDDYLADLEIDEKQDSLYAMGEKEKIIYIRSFSKTLLPGLRLGMTILPEILQEKFTLFKQSMDLNTPILTQGALEIYLKSSMYRSHITRTKRFYQKKMQALRTACQEIFSEKVRYHIPPTGIYALIETEKNTSEIIVNCLKKKNILVSSIKNCYLNDFTESEGIRFCICTCKEEDFCTVLQLIHDEMMKLEKIKIKKDRLINENKF